MCSGEFLRLKFVNLFSSSDQPIIQCLHWVFIFGVHILFLISKTSLFSQNFPSFSLIQYPLNLVWTSQSLPMSRVSWLFLTA